MGDNDPAYLLGLLDYHAPFLAARVRAKEMTALQAAKAAGLRRERKSGTNREYLLARLRRDRPDLFEKVIHRELSAHAAAVEAGIIKKPSPEEIGLERLLDAWWKANLGERNAFRWLVEEEIEAAEAGELLHITAPPQVRGKGPRPYRKREGEMGVPEIEALIDRGRSVSGLARELGVTYRTLSRWRWGETKPNQAQLEQVSRLLIESMTGTIAAQLVNGPAEGEGEGAS